MRKKNRRLPLPCLPLLMREKKRRLRPPCLPLFMREKKRRLRPPCLPLLMRGEKRRLRPPCLPLFVMIRNWCCSFIMCSYETVFWLPLFCLVLWRWGWPVNDWNVFLLPLVYLWDCIPQRGGSGKKRTSSSSSMQPLRPLNSTDPETIPFDQRLGRRIFPPVNLGQSNLRLFRFLASLGLQTSNLGQGGSASWPIVGPCSGWMAEGVSSGPGRGWVWVVTPGRFPVSAQSCWELLSSLLCCVGYWTPGLFWRCRTLVLRCVLWLHPVSRSCLLCPGSWRSVLCAEEGDSRLHVCHSWTSSSTVCDPNVDVVQQWREMERCGKEAMWW